MNTQFWTVMGLFAIVYVFFNIKFLYDMVKKAGKVSPEEIEGLIDEFIERLSAKGNNIFLYPLRIELTFNQANKYKAMATAGKSRFAINNEMIKDGQAYTQSVRDNIEKILS